MLRVDEQNVEPTVAVVVEQRATGAVETMSDDSDPLRSNSADNEQLENAEQASVAVSCAWNVPGSGPRTTKGEGA